jgi:hypothetical protein
MDFGILAGVAMLIGWAVLTFGMRSTHGWIHIFLTVGVTLIIYRIVVRGTAAQKARPKE